MEREKKNAEKQSVHMRFTIGLKRAKLALSLAMCLRRMPLNCTDGLNCQQSKTCSVQCVKENGSDTIQVKKPWLFSVSFATMGNVFSVNPFCILEPLNELVCGKSYHLQWWL